MENIKTWQTKTLDAIDNQMKNISASKQLFVIIAYTLVAAVVELHAINQTLEKIRFNTGRTC